MSEELTTKKKTESKTTPDYKELYKAECEKTKTLENKIAEYEKICKAFSEKANQANQALQSATMEYNARVRYMLDCVKHAYISIQLSNNTEKQGDTL